MAARGYVTMDVSARTYAEIRAKMIAAGFDDAIHTDGTTSCGILEHPFRYTTVDKLGRLVDYLKIQWPNMIPANAPAALALRLSLGNGTCDSYDVEEQDDGTWREVDDADTRR